METLAGYESSVSAPSVDRQQCKIKLALLFLSLAFSIAAFVTLDYLRSAMILRHSKLPPICAVPDPVRGHAFQPNCATIGLWGGDSYQFFTNNLGFRDEKIRDVPLTDPKPRMLMLGDSFTEDKIAWRDSYVGMIAAHFPQYDVLNGGVQSYSPSNYLNTTRMVLAKGVDIDEVIVFIDISDVQDEAAVYRDIDASGAVAGPVRQRWFVPWYVTWRTRIRQRFWLTNRIVEFCEKLLVGHGSYHLATDQYGEAFDNERSAWTYRKVNETEPYGAGFAPLGVEGGIAKEKAKMTLLWQELAQRNVALSVVVYPWPAQLVHDTEDSRQVRIWREWCEGKCKRFISAFPPFFAAKAQCPWHQPGCWYLNLFIFGDHHYNAAGNMLVAAAVIKSLEKDPLVKHPATNLRQVSSGIEPSPTLRPMIAKQ